MSKRERKRLIKQVLGFSETVGLWKKIQKNDKEAFDLFYHQHIDSLYLYASQINPNKTLIEDCIQEVFIQLWEKRKTIQITSSPKFYLFQCVRHLLIKRSEKQKRIVLKADLEEEEFAIFSISSSFEHSNVLVERKTKIKKAIEYLSRREKEAIFLKYYNNMDYEEVAHIMSLKTHAVYKLISRSIKKIRKRIGHGSKRI